MGVEIDDGLSNNLSNPMIENLSLDFNNMSTKNEDDKKINRKIIKIIKKYNSVNCTNERLKKLILKEFGDINFCYNNKNLLHLIVECGRYNMYDFNLIYDLIEIGVDPNFTNENGENFLQVYCRNVEIKKIYNTIKNRRIHSKLNINHRDDNGRTIMHTILYSPQVQNLKFEQGLIIYKYILLIFDIFCNKGFVEIEAKNDELADVFDLLVRRAPTYLPGKEYKNLMDHVKHLKIDFYHQNFLKFTDLLTDDVKQNKKILESVFADHYSVDKLLIEVQKKSEKQEDENKKILTTKRLLKMGLNPNVVAMSHDLNGCYVNGNYICAAINNRYSIDYILKIISLGLEHGLDLNNYIDSPILVMFQNNYSISDVILLYTVMYKHGYNNLASDVNRFDNIGKRYDMDNNEKVIMKIRKDGLILIFLELLKNTDLAFDKEILDDEEFIDLILDAFDSLKILNDSYNDYKICEKIIDIMIEERNNSIELITNSICKKELIEKMKKVFFESVNQKFEKNLIKRKDVHH